MKILDNISYPIIIAIALFLAFAPLNGESHLIEKINMLSNLTLTKPIDIFDLVLHSSPIIILILKIVRTVSQKNKVT